MSLVELPFGVFGLDFSERGLSRVYYIDQKLDWRDKEPIENPLENFEKKSCESLCSAWFRAYAQGEFWPVPLDQLDLSSCSIFQQKVLRELSMVPPATTLSYGELALRIGQPNAARAVGQALHANPLPLILPCHRIIAQSGQMGGYAYGLALKRAILQHESRACSPSHP